MPKSKGVIVIISADSEWGVAKEILHPSRVYHSPYGEWFTAQDILHKEISADLVEVHFSPIVLFHGGWGKISAAGSAQYCIDKWEPGLVVNLGTCGGIEGEIDRNVTVLARKTIVYDIDEKMGDHDAHILHYTTDIELKWLDKPYPIKVEKATILSADRDLDVKDIPALKQRYQARVVDWESAAIAYVCHKNDISVLILRTVSDLVSTNAGGEVYGNFGLFKQRLRVIMEDHFRTLPRWLTISNVP